MNLKYDGPLSNFDFECNLRHYTTDDVLLELLKARGLTLGGGLTLPYTRPLPPFQLLTFSTEDNSSDCS